MDYGFYGVFIAAGVLAVQFFFSTRNNVYWGVIMPIAYVLFLTWMLATTRIDSTLGYVLSLLLGLIFLIAEWVSGRKYLQEKRKKELDKIKIRNMK
ncbi:hypothetical protein [Bacillus xiapuensis]|uniref:hypothetical protein n=1 Tax=Bacillus xiapuensis TaxID=2014075 RepID=UPI000C23A78F|nr:hypothetical protein [Bacillus xiapuensis]